MFGRGKTDVLKAEKGDDGVKALAKIISCSENIVMEVVDAGICLFCDLYGGHETDSLTTLRHTRCDVSHDICRLVKIYNTIHVLSEGSGRSSEWMQMHSGKPEAYNTLRSLHRVVKLTALRGSYRATRPWV